MSSCSGYCLLLLVAFLSELSLASGTVKVSKSGCHGESMELFQNISIISDNTACSLYVDRKKDGPIAVWSMKNSVINPNFVNEYSDKFFLDNFGNLWVRDLHESDNAGYSIICTKGNATSRDDVKLDVLVAPEAHCRPKIVRGVDTLTTFVDGNGCGKPTVDAYFLEEPGYVRKEIKLHRQEANTFYACIDGPALKCAKSLKIIDYCTVFTDDSWFQSRVSQLSGVTTGTLAIIICVIGIGSLLTVTIFLGIRYTVISYMKKNMDSIRSVIQKENKHSETGVRITIQDTPNGSQNPVTQNRMRNMGPEKAPLLQTHNASEPALSTSGVPLHQSISKDTGVGSHTECYSTADVSYL